MIRSLVYYSVWEYLAGSILPLHQSNIEDLGRFLSRFCTDQEGKVAEARDVFSTTTRLWCSGGFDEASWVDSRLLTFQDRRQRFFSFHRYNRRVAVKSLCCWTLLFQGKLTVSGRGPFSCPQFLVDVPAHRHTVSLSSAFTFDVGCRFFFVRCALSLFVTETSTTNVNGMPRPFSLSPSHCTIVLGKKRPLLPALTSCFPQQDLALFIHRLWRMGFVRSTGSTLYPAYVNVEAVGSLVA